MELTPRSARIGSISGLGIRDDGQHGRLDETLVPVSAQQPPPAASGPARSEAARLLARVAAELGRRALGEGLAVWQPYETAYLQSLARDALEVTLGRIVSLASLCKFCSLPLELRGGGRVCCVDNHCLP